jgi:hypothetical protein
MANLAAGITTAVQMGHRLHAGAAAACKCSISLNLGGRCKQQLHQLCYFWIYFIMKKSIPYVLLVQLFLFSSISQAQNTRLKDRNSIGWFNYFGTFALSAKTSVHTEYQWRRQQWVSNWQQSLLRLGINYQVNAKLQLRFGYAWIETFPYGKYPINALGKDFTEHRLFQAATITDKLGKANLSHRFMLEQRWLGRYSSPNLTKEDDHVFVNRMRYQFRMQIPLQGKTIGNRIPYAVLYDEIFMGFGKNVNENLFDQNRIGLLLGYAFNNTIKIEAGYLNQTLQLAREINGSNVFQHNNGFVINAIINARIGKAKAK